MAEYMWQFNEIHMKCEKRTADLWNLPSPTVQNKQPKSNMKNIILVCHFKNNNSFFKNIFGVFYTFIKESVVERWQDMLISNKGLWLHSI